MTTLVRNRKMAAGPSHAAARSNTLLLLPGMMCDRAIWEPQIAALRDIATCVVPDYGAARTMTEMARAVLRDAPAHFALAGHSMGGRVALEVQRLAPERVERLCLLATEPRPQPLGERGAEELAGRMRLLATARQSGMAAMGRAWMPSVIAPARLGDPGLAAALTAMFERQTPERLEAQIAAGGARPDSLAQLASIECPVLLIAGRDDALRPAAIAEELAGLIPRCEVVFLPDCGHMMTLEQPAAVSAAMRRWLTWQA